VGERITDFITCDEEYRDALALLLGDVFVVDSVDEALEGLKRNQGVRYVTRDGVTVWPSGKIAVGVAQINREGALYRGRRLVQLRKNMPRLERDATHKEQELSVAQQALTSAQQDAFEVGQRLAELTGERASLVLDVARLEESYSSMSSENDSLRIRSDEVDREIELALRDREDFNKEIEQHATEASIAAERIMGVEGERESRFAEETRLLNALNECQIEIAQVSERDLYMKRVFTQANNEAQYLEKILSSATSIRGELEMMLERVTPLKEVCASMHEKADSLSASLADRAQFEQTDSMSLRDTIKEAQDKVRDTHAQLTFEREHLSQVKVEKGQLNVRVNAAVRTLIDDHGVPVEVALEAPELEDRQLAEDEAVALRRKLTNLGAVNPIASQEYDRLKERSDFMQAQMDDLVQARKTLGKVVNAIDKKMRERFIETYELVDGHFQDVFSVLFPGGNARLILTDPDDIDTSGVEYIVQPRGKKVRKMSLLSGGENSLAALSLLFAMNRVRPCPFFVLDEVEAALDDSNLRRFIAFINTMRDATQFLIVTHQRRTMEMADVLYGVSMQSDGVSKLVSQRLEGALASLGYETDE
jgi:chromosome segregation protein